MGADTGTRVRCATPDQGQSPAPLPPQTPARALVTSNDKTTVADVIEDVRSGGAGQSADLHDGSGRVEPTDERRAAVKATARWRSIHVEAPVEAVLAHIEDPRNFVAADPAPVELSNLALTSEGVGSTWETSWRAFGRPQYGVWTRREYVPNERVVEDVSTGAAWAFTTVAESGGTRLSLGFSFSTRWRMVNRIIAWLLASQDRQLDRTAPHGVVGFGVTARRPE